MSFDWVSFFLGAPLWASLGIVVFSALVSNTNQKRTRILVQLEANSAFTDAFLPMSSAEARFHEAQFHQSTFN